MYFKIQKVCDPTFFVAHFLLGAPSRVKASEAWIRPEPMADTLITILDQNFYGQPQGHLSTFHQRSPV
jgi:hypothetical protein